MSELRSCGFLIIRGDPIHSFLLMKHPKRWDLPKGHVDGGESDVECALRELEEETAIRAGDIRILDGFRFEHRYQVQYKRSGGKLTDKTLVILLARLIRDVKIVVTEHESFRWFDWGPPHTIQKRTIDPLLSEVAEFMSTGDV